MKFLVTMKDPDGPFECIDDAARDSLQGIATLSEAERKQLQETRYEVLRDFAGKWLKYGEYITVEFDTEAGTATVLKT